MLFPVPFPISVQGEPVQTASPAFFLPVVAAWAAAFAGHAWLRGRWPRLRPEPAAPPSSRPWLDVGVVLATTAAILGLGQLWHHGYLRWDWPDGWSHAGFAAEQLVVWSPLFLALALRRQGGDTVWVTRHALAAKLSAGVALGAIAITVFLALRGELGRWPTLAEKAIAPRSLGHALPVFLEGVGIAFLYVRLRWALGPALAALVPGALFALAHVPGSVAAGESPPHIAAFFAFNTGFVALVLLLLARTRDVVWVGAAHFLMDLAIDAFGGSRNPTHRAGHRARMLASTLVRASAFILLGLPVRAQFNCAQFNCDGRGTVRRPASIETGPPLGCAYAPDAPAFRILAPAFHDIVPRSGWRLTAARARPRLIARYRCTGLWLMPVVLRELAVYGHVLDVTATPCEESTSAVSTH